MIGRSPECEIQINGLSIIAEHGAIKNEKGKIFISPVQRGAKIRVNGKVIDDSKELQHKDRLLIGIFKRFVNVILSYNCIFLFVLPGSSHMYVFINPKQAAQNEPRVTWEMAQKEIAEAKGFSTKNTELSKEEQIIQEQIIELLPIISDVNAIAEELNKYKFFEVILVPTIAFENNDSNTSGQRFDFFKDLIICI